MNERDQLRAQVDQRADLYRDLLVNGWDLLRPGDAAYLADKLWQMGWRRTQDPTP